VHDAADGARRRSPTPSRRSRRASRSSTRRPARALQRRFREINPAIADLLVPGAAFDLLLREAVARGAIDAATARRIGHLEARVEPGAPETLEFEAANDRRVSSPSPRPARAAS
jgi:hypothetical protein